MLVKALVPGALDGRTWIYKEESPAMQIREEDAKRFDDTLEKMEKKWQQSGGILYSQQCCFGVNGEFKNKH